MVGSEFVGMVIGMSLESIANWGTDGIPAIHQGDAFVDAVFVFDSLETVVLKEVDQFDEDYTDESINKLKFKP